MVRFARAEGSKGSNKRVFEEPTPWAEMVPQTDHELSSPKEKRSKLTDSKVKKKKKQESKESITLENKDDEAPAIQKSKLTDDETIVSDGVSKVKKKKKHKNKESISLENKEAEAQEIQKSKLTDDETIFSDGVSKVKKKKKQQSKESITLENKDDEAPEIQNEEVCGNEGKIKKKKKKGKGEAQKPAQEFAVNKKGQRIKVFKDGTERPWFDLPYEDGDRMTRYDNMWVKRDMVAKLDQLKASLQEQGLDQREIMRKMMKAKRKAHRELRIELIYEQKRLVEEQKRNSGEGEGEMKKPSKQKKQKKTLNEKIGKESVQDGITDGKSNNTIIIVNSSKHGNKIVFDENEEVEHDGSTVTDELARNSENGVSDSITVNESSKVNENDYGEEDSGDGNVKDNEENQQVVYKAGKSYSATFECEENDTDELATNSENGMSDSITVKESNKGHESDYGEEESGDGNVKDNKEDQQEVYTVGKSYSATSQFEENDFMTQYDGFWVMRKAVDTLDAAKAKKMEGIYLARPDGDCSKELTAQEQQIFQRAMKKEKRFEHKKLLRELSKMKGTTVFRDGRHAPFGWGKSLNSAVGQQSLSRSEDFELVKYDGFWVKKESATRLTQLNKRLLSEGISGEELEMIMKKERRKEERLLKNERKQVCLKCRKPGHMISECPEITENSVGESLTICYKCGSTEHMARDCSVKRKGSEYVHATCFICGETGHIARECPDNPRGLYPNGGACRVCGSVEHLVRNCSEAQEENEASVIKVGRIQNTAVEALDIDERTSASADDHLSPSTTKKMKVVAF